MLAQVQLPSHIFPMRTVSPVSFIQCTVAGAYGINPILMCSPARNRSAAWPRQVAMYLARELTSQSYPGIGHLFGDRDHSTVIHAIKAVKARMASDPIYRADVEALREALS